MSRPTRRRVLAAGLGLAAGALTLPPTLAQPAPRRALVVYYSRTGNTRAVAQMVQRATGGDLVEIETVERYPDDYDQLVAQNLEEQNSGFLPPLRTQIDNLDDYDIVFVGSPLWNVRLTPPTRSFLASHEFAGRPVAPFVTYIVSRLGRAREDIAEIAPNARILDGLAVLGEEAARSEQQVDAWLIKVWNAQGG